MAISKTLEQTINDQIRKEMYSAYLYLAMSSYMEEQNFFGMAKWLTRQAMEEMEHAMKFYHYVHERGGHIVLQAIAQPPAEFGTPLQLFEQVLEHELSVTASIRALYEQAQAEKDYAAEIFLQWFIKEQVEEESNATQIVEMLKRAGDSLPMLMMIDSQLGKRGE